MSNGDQNLIADLTKPRVFIGSSTEGLTVVQELAKCLAPIAECQIWDQGIFGVGQVMLESLVKATRENDFAILVMTPDDVQERRGETTSIPRDNVIFEVGLFMGALGKDRTFIVQSSDKLITLPSDLDGITRAKFSGADMEKTCRELTEAICGAPRRILKLTGEWYSSYQRHDTRIGEWVEDMTKVSLKPPGKLSFRNYHDETGSEYEAIGELRGGEIVGVWRETRDEAHAEGSFHLYIPHFGRTLYGVCTGPTETGENIYSGWVLARDNPEKLVEVRRQLSKAMLVCRPLRPAKVQVVEVEKI